MHPDITKNVQEVTNFLTQLFPTGKNGDKITCLDFRSLLLIINLQSILSNRWWKPDGFSRAGALRRSEPPHCAVFTMPSSQTVLARVDVDFQMYRSVE